MIGTSDPTAAIDAILSGGADGTGAQLFVSADGTVVADLAEGRTSAGDPMETDTLHPAYCALKPLLALAVGDLVDDGLVLDAPCRDLAPPGSLASGLDPAVTVGRVLATTRGSSTRAQRRGAWPRPPTARPCARR